MSAADIAKALGGRPSGQGRYLCPCPLPTHGKGRGDKHPSLSIYDGDEALLVTCFSGCDRHDVIDELRQRGLIGVRGPTQPRKRPPAHIPSEPEPDEKAWGLWEQSEPLEGTPAEFYLRTERSIRLPFPQALRFHPGECAMVAALSRPSDGKIVSVQLTYLTPGGKKARKQITRQTFGAMGSGAVRLAPCDEVLGLAEGIETALSATEITGIPCWAVLGAPRIERITLPDCVREVQLFVDPDEPGRANAKKAAEKFKRQGRRVKMRELECGLDWNAWAALNRGTTDA